MIEKTREKLLKKWLKKWLAKEISKTEMMFLIDLETKFNIKRIFGKTMLNYIVDNSIKELHVFTKYKQSYTLNKRKNILYIHTPHLWFQFKPEIKEKVLFDFMNQHLKHIISFKEENKHKIVNLNSKLKKCCKSDMKFFGNKGHFGKRIYKKCPECKHVYVDETPRFTLSCECGKNPINKCK